MLLPQVSRRGPLDTKRRRWTAHVRIGRLLYRTMVKSSISNVRATPSCVDDAVSITIDRDLLDAADMRAGEVVAVRHVLTGAQIDTHVTAARRGSGTVAIRFVGTQVVEPGDRLVVTSYAWIPDLHSAGFVPRVVEVNHHNRLIGGVVPLSAVDVYGT